MPIKKASLLALAIILLALPKIAFAQNTQSPFQKAREDYTFQLTKYAEAREKYLTAKSSYKSFQTATSKNEAFLRSKDYLLQIHNLYDAYFFLIEERTNLFDWSRSSYNKDEIHKLLQDESSFITQSKKNADSVTILENIPPAALALKSRIDTKSLPTIYLITSRADLAQIEDALATFTETAQKVDQFTSTRIKDENKQLYLNWKSEIDSIKTKLEVQIKDDKEKVKTLENRTFIPRDLEQLKTQIIESKKLLTRSKELLPEILKFL